MTKEEILKKHGWYDMNVAAGNYRIPMPYVLTFMQEFADLQTTHLTDQIKSMENYISDVDGQVKELRNVLIKIKSYEQLNEPKDWKFDLCLSLANQLLNPK